MISERHAVSARAGTLRAKTRRTSSPGRRLAYIASTRQRVSDGLQRSMLVQLMLAMTFIAVAALLYLAQASQTSVLEFNIAELQAQRAQLMTQNGNLAATASNLRTLDRVVPIATTQLHMIKPDPRAVMWVQPVIPTVASQKSYQDSLTHARRESQPLSWMKHFLSSVRSAL